MPADAPAPTATPAAAPPPPANGAGKPVPAKPAAAEAEAKPASRPVVQDAPPPERPRVAPHFIKLRAEQRKLAEARAELEQKASEYEELRALREKDPWEFAQRMGFTAREVAKRAVDESKETPQDKMLREMSEKLETALSKIKAREEDDETQEEQAALAADRASIHRVIGTMPGEYPILEGEISDGNLPDLTAAFEALYQRDYEPLGEPLTAENVRAIFRTLEGNLRRFYESKASRLRPLDRASEAEPPANPETKAMPKKHVLSKLDEAERAAGKPEKKATTREERLARAVARVGK